MAKQTTAQIKVRDAGFEPLMHEASGKEIFQRTFCQSADGQVAVIAGRAPAGGVKYRRVPSAAGDQAFYVVSGYVRWRPDDGEATEWGPGDLVLVPADAAGEVEYTPDHVCLLFCWQDAQTDI